MTDPPHCCICDRPVDGAVHMIGQRFYCEAHFLAVNRPHPGFWRATVVQIVGMGLFSGVVAALASLVGTPRGVALIAIGLFLALVPSALWLVYFYRQDRLEPEPKTRVAAVFGLALLLTEAVGRPLIDQWFRLAQWSTANTLISLLASILVAGFTLQAIAYLAVRLVVYATPEFDEHMDGIVYGTVAGLGVATLLNLRYVIDNGGVALTPGVIQVVTVALAQASFGGVMGYFMARAKFEHKPVWWVPLGLTIAAVLNGLFGWLISEVSAAGLTVAPWRSLALGLVLALVVFGGLVVVMRRLTGAQPLARSGG